MISQLASPAVCVIDDDKDDYQPILAALNGLHVSTIHLLGTLEDLPIKPFNQLRLVFLDLHLSAETGKNAASRTANVFKKVVSIDTAPVIVVVWSKYASDKLDAADLLPDDQETEAQLFKRTLLEAEPKYKGRLIFVDMEKPKKDDRPKDWMDKLKAEIDETLQGQSAVELLWAWDGLVKDGCSTISRELTLIAQTAIANTDRELRDGLKATMQRLARAQSTGDFSVAMAPRHLLTALTQLLVDQLEHPTGIANFEDHGAWLAQTPPGQVSTVFPGKMNGYLLTSDVSGAAGPYVPGTVFRIKNKLRFKRKFGKEISDLVDICCDEGKESPKRKDWLKVATPVLIELSPICDVVQKSRVNSLLVGGVIVPATHYNSGKTRGDAFGGLPKFHLRWSVDNFPEKEVGLFYCHRYKIALPAEKSTSWLEPWFRLRDLPLAAIRNANAAHGARVGYVTLD